LILYEITTGQGTNDSCPIASGKHCITHPFFEAFVALYQQHNSTNYPAIAQHRDFQQINANIAAIANARIEVTKG